MIPRRMLEVPLVVEPIVPRSHGVDADRAVVRVGKDQPAEAGDLRGEVQHRMYASQVHVGDASVHVVTTRAHLVEPERLEIPALPASAGQGVEPDLSEHLALEQPHLVTLLGFAELRPTIT